MSDASLPVPAVDPRLEKLWTLQARKAAAFDVSKGVSDRRRIVFDERTLLQNRLRELEREAERRRGVRDEHEERLRADLAGKIAEGNAKLKLLDAEQATAHEAVTSAGRVADACEQYLHSQGVRAPSEIGRRSGADIAAWQQRSTAA